MALLPQPGSSWVAEAQGYLAVELGDEAQVRAFGSSSYCRLQKEAAHWQCGEERLALRRSFNLRELDAARLLSARPRAGGPGLEAQEVRQLLHSLAGGRTPEEDELDFVTLVAGGGSPGEALTREDEFFFALKAWYALSHMPESVAAALAKLIPAGQTAPLPSPEALHTLLLELNGLQPVEAEEVAAVRAAAVHLGATEEAATAAQLRRAVAAWYLHIERPATPTGQLLRHSLEETHSWMAQQLGAARPPGKVESAGEPPQSSRGGGCLLLAVTSLLVLCLVVPGAEILAPWVLPTPPSCEHPQLGLLLRATGTLSLVLSAAVVFAVGATRAKVESWMVCGWSFAAAMSVVLVGVYLVGVAEVMTSTSARCGAALWQLSHLAYVTVPTLVVLTAGCGLPGAYCLAGGQAFLKNLAVDESLLPA